MVSRRRSPNDSSGNEVNATWLILLAQSMRAANTKQAFDFDGFERPV